MTAIKSLFEFAGGKLWSTWIPVLEHIAEFAYKEVWLTGDFGTGKTTATILGAIYDLYKLKKSRFDNLDSSMLPLKFAFNNSLIQTSFNAIANDLLGDTKDWLETILVKEPVHLKGETICGAIFTKPDFRKEHNWDSKQWQTMLDECERRIENRFGNKSRVWIDAGDYVILKEEALKDLLEYATSNKDCFVKRADRSMIPK